MHWFLGVVAVGELRRHMQEETEQSRYCAEEGEGNGIKSSFGTKSVFMYILDSMLQSVTVARKEHSKHLQVMLRSV